MSIHARKATRVRFTALLRLLVVVFALPNAAWAQQGVSTAAAARARYLSEIGSMPTPREVAVEEFVNYHQHQIGRPKAGEAVAMDLRWGDDQVSGPGQEAVLQVGFSTAIINDREHLRPINLSLVIDKSGSMHEVDKMSRVKSALLTLVSKLREDDTLSIVVFDSEAQVLMPARRLTDRRAVRQLIQQITPGGGTNIHAGLMLGYQEAWKSYRKDSTNRVILLTDGIANHGETDPGRIAQDSLRFNDKGIDLSTIGVGLDLNRDLLSQLAKSGRGLFHFVEDAQDIEKVFAKESQSLISPVATDPDVEIDYDPGLELAQIYGYEPRLRKNGATLKLDNMNRGLTQVILLRFRLADRRTRTSRIPIRVRFTYYDLEQKRQIVNTEESYLTVNPGLADDVWPAGNSQKDPEVGKNYSIALLAQAIHDMAALCEGRRFREAESQLASAITTAYRQYPHREDEDISRVLTIAQKYQARLKTYNKQFDPVNDK